MWAEVRPGALGPGLPFFCWKRGPILFPLLAMYAVTASKLDVLDCLMYIILRVLGDTGLTIDISPQVKGHSHS